MTSGGDAPGMNAAIRSVVRTCAYYNIKCIGIYRGYEGLIAGDFVEMNARSVRDIINKGGTILRSARSKEFRTIEGRKKAYQKVKEENLDALIVIGGDGSGKSYLINTIVTIIKSLTTCYDSVCLEDLSVGAAYNICGCTFHKILDVKVSKTWIVISNED